MPETKRERKQKSTRRTRAAKAVLQSKMPTKSKAAKSGPKGKYLNWIGDAGVTQIKCWARNGLTNEEIAEKIGISRKTLQQWRNKYTVIGDALKEGKEYADLTIEDSLFKRAQGYTIQVTKHAKVKTITYDEKTGKKLKEFEEMQEYKDDLHIPADVGAIIFWLKNRKPKDWRNTPAIEVPPDAEDTYFIQIPEILPEPKDIPEQDIINCNDSETSESDI